ncbi:MAG: hypothetical protein ACYCZB_01890 [Acidiphilium sp.]
MSAPPTPPTPAERFARCIRDLRDVIAAQGLAIRLPSPLILLVWARIRRLAFRFAQSVANSPRPRKPRPADARPRPAKPRERAAGEPCLPTGYAWLRRLIPDYRINFCVGAIRDILENPEMAALIAATPTAGRALRPLCHILGIPLPPNLRLPSRPKPEKPANRRSRPKPRIASRKHPLVRDAIAPKRPARAKPPRRAHPRAPPVWL